MPAFTLGGEDGVLVRDLMGDIEDGRAPRVRIRFNMEMTPDLQSSLVWGTLPGTTDETI